MRKIFPLIVSIGVLLVASCAERPALDQSHHVSSIPAGFEWPQAHELLPSQPAGINPITCNCGAYQDQTVLRVHGKQVPLHDLYTSAWARDGCNTLPWDVATILARYGIQTESHYYASNAGFLAIAMQSLRRGHPLVVVIQATRGHGGLHWISLWSFDARRQVFGVYDSQYETKVGGLGNTEYSIARLESRLPWWTPLTFWMGTTVEIEN